MNQVTTKFLYVLNFAGFFSVMSADCDFVVVVLAVNLTTDHTVHSL